MGITDNNPFRQQLSAIVEDLPPIFEVQALDRPEQGWQVFAGLAESAWLAAVAASDAFYDAEVAEAAIVGVFGAKAKNLYQASRGVTQLALQAAPPISIGSPIALVTEAPDGLGEGPGERAFADAIRRGRDALLRELAAASDDTTGHSQTDGARNAPTSSLKPRRVTQLAMWRCANRRG